MLDFSQGGVSSLLSSEKRMPGRPIFELLLWAEYTVWGENARAFHTTGILLHIISSCLLALVCRQLGSEMITSLTAGLFFLLGVSHFRAVHWISAHCYPLAFIFCSLTVVFFSRWQQKDGTAYVVATYAFALSGILTHISAVLALPICLIAHIRRENWKRRSVALIPLITATVACILFIRFYYSRAPQITLLSEGLNPIESARAYSFMLGRLLATTHWVPAALYKTHVWEYYLGAVAAIGASWAIFFQRGMVSIWCSWTLLGLLPFMLLDPTYVQEIATGPSRYLYFANAGVVVLISMGLMHVTKFVAQRSTKLAVPFYVSLMLLICFSGSYYLRRTEAVSQYSSGRYFAAAGDISSAIAQYQRALAAGGKRNVDREDIYHHLGLLLPSVGEDAFPVLQRGVQEFPESLWLNAFLAVLEQEQESTDLRDLGRRRSAQVYTQAGPLKDNLDFNISALYHNLGAGYVTKKQYAKAVYALRSALEIQPQKKATIRLLEKAYAEYAEND